MEQEQTLTLPTEVKSTARRETYVTFIERYPVYSILLVLKEYEDKELYEECAIIKNALEDYKDKYKTKIPKDVNFPTHISVYNGEKHQQMLRKFNIVVEEKFAKEKAKLIKIKLPIKNGL